MKQRDKYTLFVDTETSGIPVDTTLSYRNIDNWPTIKQIAWIIYKKDGTLIAQHNYATAEEGERKEIVSPTYISKKVLPIHEIVKLFYLGALPACDVIVGHNIEYDIQVIMSELHRYGYNTEPLSSMHQFCTMKNSVDICGFDTSHGDRYPKLQELYSKLFHKPFENAHDAYCDIKATADCFWKVFSCGMLNKEDFPYLLTNEEKTTTANIFLEKGKEFLTKYLKQEQTSYDEELNIALSWFEKALRIKSNLKYEVGEECFRCARYLCGDIINDSYFTKTNSSKQFELVQEALFFKQVDYYETFKTDLMQQERPSKYEKFRTIISDAILNIIKSCF